MLNHPNDQFDPNWFIDKRKSYIEIGQIYFWTATINKWQRLLWDEEYKNVVLNSLEYLSGKGKVDVFSFVIMPNHIHLIWRTREKNGKESAQGSFLKFTAHEFKRKMKTEGVTMESYRTDAPNKIFEFWQRDPLAIHLFSKEVAFQKIDYIHGNPCAEHWQLANEPWDYQYSSAAFYEKNEKTYSFLKDIRDEF